MHCQLYPSLKTRVGERYTGTGGTSVRTFAPANYQFVYWRGRQPTGHQYHRYQGVGTGGLQNFGTQVRH